MIKKRRVGFLIIFLLASHFAVAGSLATPRKPLDKFVMDDSGMVSAVELYGTASPDFSSFNIEASRIRRSSKGMNEIFADGSEFRLVLVSSKGHIIEERKLKFTKISEPAICDLGTSGSPGKCSEPKEGVHFIIYMKYSKDAAKVKLFRKGKLVTESDVK